jgi:excisionase family DNA binding protein
MNHTKKVNSPSANTLPRLLNIGGLAEHLGVQERHIRRLVHERRIPFVKWGHLIRFDPDEVRAWLDRARVPGERHPRGR